MSIIAHCEIAILRYGYNCRAKARHFTVLRGNHMRTLGSSTGELPKVPTLRQAIKARLNLPARNWVSLIFPPGKYSVITLVCEDKFRVNVREEEPLYRDLLEIIDTLNPSDVTLFVDIPEGSEGRFEVLVDDDTVTTWTKHDWGYRCETIPEKKKRAGKKPRATLESASEA